MTHKCCASGNNDATNTVVSIENAYSLLKRMFSCKGYTGQSLKIKILVGQGDILTVPEIYVFHINITGRLDMVLFIIDFHLSVLPLDIIKPILLGSE